MAQSLSRLWTHLIFSTKNRFPFLKEPQTRNDMHAYLAKILRSHDCETLIIGGTSDHIHALFDLSRKIEERMDMITRAADNQGLTIMGSQNLGQVRMHVVPGLRLLEKWKSILG